MRTATTTFTASLLIASLLAPTAVLAANPHFQGGQPTITVNADDTITASGTLAGLGNEDLSVTLLADATVLTLCHNPSGNIAPGQTKTPTVEATDTEVEVKNGKATFSVTTEALTVEDLTGKICPNAKWMPEIDDVTFSNFRLTISQGGELLFNCTGINPTSCVAA